MKRLTDGMKIEMVTISNRVDSLHAQFVANVTTDQYYYALSCLNSQHGYELETYKVRLENFYSETDAKEQTFQNYYFQTYLWNHRGFSAFIRWNILPSEKRIWNVFQEEKLGLLYMLDQIASLQDETSDDCERYLKMRLRLDPNSADTNFRNEKDAHYPFIHQKHFGYSDIRFEKC